MSAICQKLSASPHRLILAAGSLATSCQSSNASSSGWWTVAHILSGSKPYSSVHSSAGAYARLGARRPLVGALLAPEEGALELHHPSVREQQGRILGRDQAGRMHVRMTVAHKVVQESLPYLFGSHRIIDALSISPGALPI